MTYDHEIIENMPPGLQADAIRFGPEEAMRMAAVSKSRADRLRCRDTGGTVLQAYTLQLLSGIGRERHAIAPGLLREMEENLTDLLPEGYSVRIREWDEEG